MSNASISQSKIVSCLGFPKFTARERRDSFLIYDKNLEKFIPDFNLWIKGFPNRQAVLAGEKLKSLKSFQKFLESHNSQFSKIQKPHGALIVVGGGSVGDFGGFVASVLRRGVPLIHVPSTWLASIDSAHGGKTALNVLGVKNQIGSFYPAKKIVFSKKILFAQKEERWREALSEAVKILMLSPLNHFKKLKVCAENPQAFFNCIEDLARLKMKIVDRDPLEQNGHRYLLNLGHTFGHIVESAKKLPHGKAVALGLAFALEFSLFKKHLNFKNFEKLSYALQLFCPQVTMKSLPSGKKSPLISFGHAERLLNFDKKNASHNSVNFVLIQDFGRGKVVPVLKKDLLKFAKQKGYLR